MNRKLIALAVLMFMTSPGVTFEASLVTSNGTSPVLDTDRTSDFNGFFSGFPEEFSAPENVGSFSFRDQSIENPDMFLNLSGNSSVLQGNEIQLYYTSKSGNITEPVLIEPVTVPSFTGDYVMLDLEISAFSSINPGRLRAGIIEKKYNKTGNSTELISKDVTNLSSTGGLMDGNFSIVPSIQSVAGKTKLEVDEVFNGTNHTLYTEENGQEVLISVTREGEILDEMRAEVGKQKAFNFTFSGGEEVFVNGILSLETKSVGKCETITDNDFYYLLNSSQFNVEPENGSCLKIEDTNNAIVDFANKTIDGTGNQSENETSCAVRLSNTSDVTVKNPRVQQFDRGICLYSTESTLISGTSAKENNLGIYMNNSTAEIREIGLKNQDSEIKGVNTSVFNMTDVDFDTGNISGGAEDLKIRNVYNPPPPPEDDLKNISQWINISETKPSGHVTDLGFHYAPVSETNVNPLYMYKFDLKENTSGNTTESYWESKNLSIVKKPTEKVILKPGSIGDFSVFGVYGEEIKGDPGNNDTEEGGQRGGSEAPGSGQAEGGAGGGLRPEPEPEPEPTPVELNLSLEEEYMEIEQGGTKPVNFSVENVGDVAASDVYVEARVDPGWETGRQDYSNIPPGRNLRDNILLSVYQSEILGNYTIPVEARSSTGSTLDTDYLTIGVVPRTKTRDLQIVQGPTFLSLEAGEETSVGFLLENTGDFRLENITASVRNAPDCIESASGSQDLQIGERKNVEYSFETKNTEGTCTGVVLFSSNQEQNLGFTPVRMEIKEPSIVEKLTTNILPALTLVWTLLTIYWVRRRFYE
jgi:hypothetical protein